MRRMRALPLRALVGLAITATVSFAEGPDVESEVAAALAAEKAGFNARDCAATLEYWHYDAQMLVEGRVRASSRAEMVERCERVMASLPPDLDNRNTVAEDVHVLSPTSAFTVTQYPRRAIVTKIWRKTEAGWKIVHLHESIGAEAPPGGPRD